MSAYTTVVVGTDGSPTSYVAVERAAAVARDSDAELVLVSAYTPASREDTLEAEDALGAEAYQVRGWSPAEEALRTAEDKAAAVGATKITKVAEDGAPADVLRKAVKEHDADLLVVGNKGLNTLSGRILGSVPSDVARRSGVDVLIVHTT
ncbi:universal stress protein [Pseudonocardia halophobica]|uniref:Universal stress protein n=1 Tax=Pseudonocardia halophobica TaxID=29401 RepID=A0A9W6L406_9PSEU|nr:universal stress protein [Pseudonocardia halophobica]GLL11720.1 universal stress protein [Pseudonocardia halophobica]